MTSQLPTFPLKFLILLHFIAVAPVLQGQTFPNGFSQTKVGTVYYPTAMAKTPDGRIFICEKGGKVKVFKNGAVLSTSFIELSNVEQTNERGLGGIAIDPDFSTNHYVYLYYTTTNPVHNRLIRVTANGDVATASSMVTLVDFETVVNSIHNGGGMAFGPDGKLYLAMGDDKVSTNAPSLSTHKGKLLRMNKDGSAASGNPFTGTNQASRIWAYGFRNPFSISIQPVTGKIFVNDVGEGAWEEINNATNSGQNFGWPGAEGNSSNSAYTNPVYTYHHTNGTALLTGCAVSGGAFFSPSSTNYPSQYSGKYFFIDYCNDWINYIDPSTGSVTNFASNLPGAGIAVSTGPDGNLYYMSISQNGLYKIVYNGGAAPVITQQPESQSVSTGQQAVFSVGASGATPLTYQWMKNNVNITGATSATYIIQNAQTSQQGQYRVTVTNSAGTATSSIANLTVTAFNNPPVASISAPAPGAFYRGGDTIYFAGNATDSEDGVLAASAFTWVVEFHHDVHYHPGPNIAPGVKSGSFIIPFTGESSANVKYKIRLFVKDSDGGRDTVNRDILPYTSKVTFKTIPPGLQVAFEGQPNTATYSVMAVERMRFNLEAPTPQNLGTVSYTFNNWSQGGAGNQTITIPQNDATLTATFDSTGAGGCVATGQILREYWSNITSSSLADIPFNSAPTGSSMVTSFAGPSNFGNLYGSRIRGFICPPATGNYTFYIASDNNSELWLSTSENPTSKTKIAYVSGYTKVGEWAKYPEQKSAAIMLQQGKKYYVEAIHRENTEGDHLAVGWRTPAGVVERPIPGTYLSPFTQGMQVSITSPGQNASFTPGSNVTINAAVSDAQGIQKVEFLVNSNKIGEDNSAPYTFTWNNVQAGTYTLTARGIASTTVTSQPVVVNVQSASGCVSTGTIVREVWTNVSGAVVSNIPLTTPPSFTDALTQFKTTSNSGDNYGERIRGLICPPTTGSYTFWIASDDNSELWLSSSSNPLQKQKIAYVTGYTQSQEYTKYTSQQSQPVTLQANQQYYIEALHKEGTQGDNLAVGWRLPNGTLERPIPGNRLSATAQPLAAFFTSPADNSTFTEGAQVVLEAGASGGSGNYQKMEFFKGSTKMGEDLSPPFTHTIQSAVKGTYHLSVKVTDSQSVTASSGDFHIHVTTVQACAGTGYITRELWNNVNGTTVNDIPLTSQPSTKQQLTSFKSAAEIGDNYGQRIRGYICPPATGNYVFYISSDDNSELWISNGESVTGRQQIASIQGWTFPDEWTKYESQTSQTIALTAGNKYYIEALHKEGTEGDHVAVGWKLPDNTFERPVPGSRLMPFEEVPVAVCDASIQPGGPTTFCDGGSVMLYANTAAGYNYQWKKDGTAITGATVSSYQTNAEGDYQVNIYYTGCNAWSAPVHVTVNDFLTARITPGGPTTFCDGENVVLYGNTCDDYLYQWKVDGSDIPGANAPTYTATASGSYQLKIISGASINWSALVDVTVNDCGQGKIVQRTSQKPEDNTTNQVDSENTETTAQVTSVAENKKQVSEGFRLKVFPNPTTGMFSFDYCIEETKPEIVQIKVLSASTGQVVYEKAPERVSGCVRANIGLSGSLSTGVYVLQLTIGDKAETTKLVLYR